MRRFLFALLALGLIGSSCAATLRLSGTAPTQDNISQSCSAPILTARGSAPVAVHFAWSGPVTGEDSLLTVTGALITFTRNLPAGSYLVRCWASDSGGVGCDTTLAVNLKGPPWKVRL